MPSDDHDQLREFVRGRLGSDEAASLAQAVADDPSLAAELRLVEALVRTDTARHPFPGDDGWTRLARAIEAEGGAPSSAPGEDGEARGAAGEAEQDAPTAAMRAGDGPRGRDAATSRAAPSHIRGSRSRGRAARPFGRRAATPSARYTAPWNRRITMWQAAAGIVAVVVGWQLTMAPRLAGPADAPRYTTATGGAGGAPSAASGPGFRVVFNPDATEAAIRTLLRDLGGTIVDGPSALGFYTLAFADAAAREAALARLTDQPSVVEFVESD